MRARAAGSVLLGAEATHGHALSQEATEPKSEQNHSLKSELNKLNEVDFFLFTARISSKYCTTS
tara:strand:- start:238 stop:429 length:192 start_codon:yes stop_codon:yes gene_type:complete